MQNPLHTGARGARNTCQGIMSVDRLFDELGHFKRFQACLYFAAVFQAIACGIHYLASVFLVERPSFVCAPPGNVTDVLYGNYTGASLEEVLPFFKPANGPMVVRTAEGKQWELSTCQRTQRMNPTDFTYEQLVNRTTEKCDSNYHYVYDHSEVYQSIVTDWDLVCDREWLAKLCQPTFMMGVLVGALVFGDIADRVGRRRILMITSLCQFVFGVSVAFTGNYYLFMFIRFLLAMVSSGYLVVVFVYVTEFTGNKVRTWTSMHVHAAFAVGVMMVAVMGYLVRTWRSYQILLSTCTSPFLFFCWKFPETPFYLMAKGRLQETQVLLDSIARFNGLEPGRLKAEDLLEPEEALLEKEVAAGVAQPAEPEKKLSILDLFGTWRMGWRTVTVGAVWFISSLGYYVFSLGSVNLGGNQYINLFLAGAVEFPSYLIGCYAMDRVGRKRTCAPALLLAGMACMLIIVVPNDIEVLAIFLSMTGKFAIAIAFGLIYLYTCELYPTIIRSLAVGSGSMMCRVGSVVAPFCVYLADIWQFLPQLIVGILAFIIGVLTLWLPETLGEPLTSTMEEAEALGRKKNPEEDKKDPEEGMEMNLNQSN
ncbi:solute carrier family 22 member 16-like [Oncorhynchus nerka]|uniref:Solute carrier family 22 member 16 n=1 Tax=Oncorhynchus tshawytscha TaxID=74940 RepID=A0A8C8MFJ4_ONCTS|nr:LOW QUALITY PROTEIN: solute carrier family 22 member 16-like [Oncorhynchus nerka]XP_042156800.1 solute carrier family 22 member 16 isoform X4 [Oncorhynchus tshawytscha]